MNLSSDYSDPILAERICQRIEELVAQINRPISVMEVCGTHTVALRQSGVRSLLPPEIRLISGPGCPVCVTPTGYIDNALLMLREKGCVIVSFGDMLKVPGRDGETLGSHTGSGLVRMVYSPKEVLAIARSTEKPVVFLGIGFETTIPPVMSAILQGDREGLDNLFLYSAFKTVPPALQALLADPNNSLDGFLLPGHVSVVIGRKAYRFLEEDRGLPSAITGFEPIDMLLGIAAVLARIANNERRVDNVYLRAVREEGNRIAQALLDESLEPSDDPWRGLGTIPGGGLKLKDRLKNLDAVHRFELGTVEAYDQPGCRCGEVIQGRLTPPECALFGTVCTPDTPSGPCMVSSEGTCAAYLRFGNEAKVPAPAGR